MLVKAKSQMRKMEEMKPVHIRCQKKKRNLSAAAAFLLLST